MSAPRNSHYLSLFRPNPPKLSRHTFSFFTFYYHTSDNLFTPVIISKPGSTQLPHYFPTTAPTFPTLQALLTYYTSNNPLL